MMTVKYGHPLLKAFCCMSQGEDIKGGSEVTNNHKSSVFNTRGRARDAAKITLGVLHDSRVSEYDN